MSVTPNLRNSEDEILDLSDSFFENYREKFESILIKTSGNLLLT